MPFIAVSARATSATGSGGVCPRSTPRRISSALDNVDGVVEPRAVGGLDRVVVARGLVEREQQRAVLAERADREREPAAQRLAVARLVVGERLPAALAADRPAVRDAASGTAAHFGHRVRRPGPTMWAMRDEATFRVKAGLAEMLKGGVIMDVVDAEQAKIAEDAGAAAVMALERVPADIRRDGGVARMSDPVMIKGIQEAVTIPVMAKARIGHFAEAQVLEALEVDYIDESEVLTPGRRGPPHRQVGVPGPVRLRRDQPRRGAAADRRGRGDDPLQGRGRHRRHRRGRPPPARDHRRDPAPRHARRDGAGDRRQGAAAPLDLVVAVAREGRLPVPLFCAGGIATPADASLVMQLGAEGVFVGSGIFKSEDPAAPRARDRRGDHALRRRRARRRASEGLGARDGSRSRRASSTTSSCSPSRGW